MTKTNSLSNTWLQAYKHPEEDLDCVVTVGVNMHGFVLTGATIRFFLDIHEVGILHTEEGSLRSSSRLRGPGAHRQHMLPGPLYNL
ncbi:hypothetical protein EYZ11_003483 [Aspergillus tanneri]|uniref:Uncharacterized protein n=1 Tax=Aspergillus tanneri TaxID=1220188 RepID=A0A4S3JNM6_9EURO|nr:hypothetical protein EYZ11_003483 [Aspergillus tanneri]